MRDPVVVAHDDATGSKRLIGYIVATDDNAPTVAQLRAHLARVLPEYMLPAQFLTLEALPLGPTGKLDPAGGSFLICLISDFLKN